MDAPFHTMIIITIKWVIITIEEVVIIVNEETAKLPHSLNTSLSLLFRSEQNIYVVGVNPSGAAGVDGRIKVGDQILEVNGTPLNAQNNHQLASNVIKNSPSNLVFVINRLELVAITFMLKNVVKNTNIFYERRLGIADLVYVCNLLLASHIVKLSINAIP